jgi:hypothetical protein
MWVREVLLCIFLWCFSIILELFRQCVIFGTVQPVCYFWKCTDSVLFLELFRQCAIFGTVQTVCYFWNCTDSVLFLELFRQCAIFGTVQTVCYFWNCLDSLLLLELFRQCAIFVLFFVLLIHVIQLELDKEFVVASQNTTTRTSSIQKVMVFGK